MSPTAAATAAGPSLRVASLDWAPLLPTGLLIGLGVLCALALGLAFARRASGTVWRLLASLLLLLWLSGPHLVRATWQALPQTALLVIDGSGSMAVGQRRAVAARAAAALRAAAARLGAGAPAIGASGIELRSVVVGSGPSGGTRLFEAIARASADIPSSQLAGILALTDGQVHDVPASLPERLAGGPGRAPVPFQALITASGEQTDRRLRVLQAPPYAIIGHDATLRVEVEDLGVGAASPGSHAPRWVCRRAAASRRRAGDLARGSGRRAAGHHAAGHPPGPDAGRARRAAAARRGLDAEQPGGGADQRGARPAARAAGLGHAEPGRAGLAAGC